MLKRIGLFLATNLAVIVLLNLIFFIIENILGIKINGIGYFVILALVIGFGGSFISLLLSKWVAKKAYNIVIVNDENINQLDEKEKNVYENVKKISLEHNIKIPEVGFYLSDDANAFATGASKNSSLVAVSSKLLETMNDEEIQGVIGHEMSHILNGDMITMTLIQGILNTFVVFLSRIIANIASQFVDEKLSWLVYFIVGMLLEIIFGLFASIIVMWFSRKREFKADEGSAKILGKSKMIASLKALQKMEEFAPSHKNKLATMQISTNTKGFMKIFMSHPDLELRIKNLENKF